MPFDVVPIIEIPGYGNQSAILMCEKYGIKSPKDTDKLLAAKLEVYQKGFYEGVLLVGMLVNTRSSILGPNLTFCLHR